MMKTSPRTEALAPMMMAVALPMEDAGSAAEKGN
jgi:hypothetical protein